MKILVILLVVILLFGGGAGAGWWFFLREQPADEATELAEGEATSLVSISRIFKLDPIVLPVVREGQVTLHVSAVVVVELVTALERVDLRDLSIPIRDSMIRELYGIYAMRYVQERGYNIPVVRERLKLGAERVLGEGTVRTVRLQDITKRVPDSG